MTLRTLVTLIAAVFAAVVAGAQSATAVGNGRNASVSPLVFVQTNEPTGNRVLVFDRGADGQLTPAGAYATGGDGAYALPGTESDTLASQGSLVYVGEHRLLLAVNAGSDSVSVFRVRGNALELAEVLPSGGDFPASIAIDGRLVYVLNSGGVGSVQGFRITGDGLQEIPHSSRSLGLANTDPPDFLMSPGQVGFTPDGGQLIVTTKVSGSTIDVFGVSANGRLSDTAVENPSATPVPFAFTFTPNGRLAMGEAGVSAITTYAVQPAGTLVDPKSQSDGQVALCWIQRVGPFYYVSNTASNNLSAFTIAPDGQPSLVGATGIVATTQPGPIDLTSPPGTPFLYAQTGSGTVHEYRVNGDGTLTPLGAVPGLPTGMEGIAST